MCRLSPIARFQYAGYAGFSKGVTGHCYNLGAHRANDRVLYPYWGGMFGSGASMAFSRASSSPGQALAGAEIAPERE